MRKDKLIGSGLMGFGLILIIISFILVFPIQNITNNQYTHLNVFENEYPVCSQTNDPNNIYSPNYIVENYRFLVLVCNVNSNMSYGLDIVHIDNSNNVKLASYFELTLKINQSSFQYWIRLSDLSMSNAKTGDIIEFRLYNATVNELLDYSVSNYLDLNK